jgi:phospholipid/cholesterol/gamma-HCH transport system substrate-binding protein
MKVRFNHFERVAGLFVLIAVGGAGLSAVSVAIKQGWFETKVKYHTVFENADGVHGGTTVKMAGLNAGSVDEVELLEDNRVRVTFHVLGKFKDRIKTDSKAMLIRPFIIGDRVLEVAVGSPGAQPLAENMPMTSEESVDMMTLLSGRKMTSALAEMSKLMESLQMMATAFSDPKRIEMVIRMFDRMEPLLENMNTMSREVTDLSKQLNENQVLRAVMKDARTLLAEMNRILPAVNEHSPEFGRDMATLMKSMSRVSQELEVGFVEVSPEVPGTAKRMVELMHEATVLIKAMQKSMFVRGSVEEVRAEESSNPKRWPASAPRK